MDAAAGKECSALGGLFQLIMTDMKAGFPTWEDFVSKGAKLQSQLRTTIMVTGAFLDAFQKVADMATGTRGATKEIGSALTRMCMRHRSIESKLKLFTTALSESLVTPLELKMEEWKRVASQLDKDHAKEYKKARADIKKKSSDTIKLQKKVKKGKGEARGQLDSALQDVNVRYAVLEEAEKRAVVRALIEERARYCSFVSMLKPVLDHEINMLGEVTHLQTILEDLTTLTAEPSKLPAASEQVILDLKGSDFTFTYQTPPPSPSLSRKSSISSNYQCGSVRLVPSLESISAADSVHLQDAMGSTNQLSGGSVASENGLLAPPHMAYAHHGERARAMSASGKSCSARDQLALTLGALNSDTSRSSRDSLHCSSGYSTQTTTPSCSEDTIHTHVDYESISLHGDGDSVSLRHVSHGGSQSDLDKSSTLPRNSDLRYHFRELAQSKRPASTVSLLAESELSAARPLPSHTATIRRKPSSKPAYRRGTISGGVPIPISTPQVPLRAPGGGSDENVFKVPPVGGVGGLGLSKLCTSTQSLSALPPSSSSSPYYQLVPGQMPIPVPVPTVPSLPAGGSNFKQHQNPNQQYQNPNQQYQNPNQQHQNPNQQYQNPNQQHQNPNQQHQNPNQQHQNPNQQHQNPNQQHQNPKQQYQTHNQQYQNPNPQYQTHNQQYQNPNPQHQTHNQQYQNPNQQHQNPNQQYQTHNQPYQTHNQPYQTHNQPYQTHNQQYQNPNQQHQNPNQQYQNPNQQHQNPNQQHQNPNQQYQNPNQQQKQKLFHHQGPVQTSMAQGEPPVLGYQPQLPPPSSQELVGGGGASGGGGGASGGGGGASGGGGDMLTLIKRVKLKRTLTNDRSAPLLPPPTNHK